MKRITELRKEKRMTQTALALKLNVTQNMISFYEKGKYQPSIGTLIELSKIFNVSVDYLIENTEVRYKADDIVAESLTPIEANIIGLIKKMSNEEQQRAIGIIQAVSFIGE